MWPVIDSLSVCTDIRIYDGHKFAPTRFYNSFGSHEPALRLGDGDTVVPETLDAHGFDREARLARSYKRVRSVKSVQHMWRRNGKV